MNDGLTEGTAPPTTPQQHGSQLSQLARTVFRLSRRFRRQLDGSLEARFQLGPQDFSCLASVEGGLNTPSQLTAYQGIPAPTTSRIVARLEGRGLLRRGAVAGDLRRCQLTLTPQGRELLGQMRAEMAELLQESYGDLDPALIDDTLRHLQQLERRLGNELDLPPSSSTTADTTNAASQGDPT